MDFVFLVVVALAASFVNTLTGFGYALVSMPTWVLVMDPKAAVVLTQLSFAMLAPVIVWQARKDVDRDLFVTLLLPSFVGLPIGAYVLVVIDQGLLRLLIGAATVLAAVALLFKYRRRFRRERLAAAVTGFLMGLLTTGIGVSGPLVVLFMANQGVTKDRLRATIAAFTLGMVLASLVVLYLGGLLTMQLLLTGLLLFPASLVGFLLAVRILPAVDPEMFHRVTVVLVLLAGLALVASEIGQLLGS